MNMRKHKRARQALQAKRIAFQKWLFEGWDRSEYPEDDDDEYDDRLSCTHCGGEGYCQVDDPFWDECDEYGYGPCTYCDGTGDRSHQTVF